MASKRDQLAQALYATGITRLARGWPKRPSLIVLNYHRIGDHTATLYDSGVFSATPEEFDWQLEFLASRYHVATLHEAVDFARGNVALSRTSVLLTFDDGYLDNYEFAFPILRRRGLSATFFLATSFVGSSQAPWWDEIAYLTKTCKAEQVRLSYPEAMEIPLQDRNSAVKQILDVFKSPRVQDPERFLAELREACRTGGGEMPLPSERLFLNWQEAEEMLAGGMFIGSHTHSHRLLGKLTEQEQRDEVSISKDSIEGKLKIRCNSLAYPVGKQTTFSTVTQQALKDSGYDVAFSFYGGINGVEKWNPFDIKRVAVEASTTKARFALQMNLAAATTTYWF
jgi:peptidoglycan/xylan/chitin deacetylase (PgdA/CDA1 family)